MGKIKAIGFDYGGVIGSGQRSGKKFSVEVCELLGIDQEVYREAYFSMNSLINLGKIATWREFWQLFLEKLHLPAEQIEPLVKISDKFASTYTEMDGQVLNLIDRLRSLGYKVGLLSNATKENAKLLRKAGLDKHFDAFLISAEIGIQKPDVQAFALLAEKLGVQISELAFVDDAPTSLSTAESCGFTPVLFLSCPQLVSDLTALGVLD